MNEPHEINPVRHLKNEELTIKEFEGGILSSEFRIGALGRPRSYSERNRATEISEQVNHAKLRRKQLHTVSFYGIRRSLGLAFRTVDEQLAPPVSPQLRGRCPLALTNRGR